MHNFSETRGFLVESPLKATHVWSHQPEHAQPTGEGITFYLKRVSFYLKHSWNSVFLFLVLVLFCFALGFCLFFGFFWGGTGSHVPQFGIKQCMVHLLHLSFFSMLWGNFDLSFFVGRAWWGAWSHSNPAGLKLNDHLPTSASLPFTGLQI